MTLQKSGIITLISRLRASAVFSIVCLFFLALGTGLATLLLGAAIYGLPAFWAYFTSARLLILNLLPCIILAFAFYFATCRAWIAFLAPSFVLILAAVVSFYKVQLRGDPLLVEDIVHAASAAKILSNYTVSLNWKALFAALYLVFGTVFAAVFCRYRPHGQSGRLIPSLIAFGMFFSLSLPLYSSDALYSKVSSGYAFDRESATEDYIARGFIYPFFHSVKAAFPSPPEGYTRAKALEILEKYEHDDIPQERRVNIISVMLEAFTDMSEYDEVEFQTDVYEKWHLLQKESVSGYLLDNIFGGGTIDTERLFLTGEVSLRSINNKTQSYLYYLKDNGYYTEGFHSGFEWFYNRRNIHRAIGFDNYYFIEDFDGASTTDTYFFNKLLEMYESRDKELPYFSHNLSIQNHGGYYEAENYGTGMISRGDLSETSFNILSNYLVGIYDTNERIYDFINELRDDSEPVVVLLYGDHKPWLGVYEKVYTELGINLDTSTDDGFFNYYSTPYIIWANDAAKALLENDFTGDGGTFSPCFLMNKLFELCSYGGDRYMKTVNTLYESITVINTPTGQYVENGIRTSDLSALSHRRLLEVRYAAYYRQYNFDK